MRPSDLLGRRAEEIITALRDADAMTREAALTALVTSVRSLRAGRPTSDLRAVAEHCGRLLLDFPDTGRRALQVEGLLDVATVLFLHASPATAAQYARPALALARTLDQPDLHRRAANDSAGYCLRQRDFAGALGLLSEAHDVSVANGLEDGRLRALTNIAACLQEAGHYRRAAALYRRTAGIEAATGGTARDRQLGLLGNLVHCHLVLGELPEALAAGERGAELVDGGGDIADALVRHQFESFFSAALLDAGRTIEARARLRQLQAQSPPNTPHAEVLFSLTQGACEVFSGHVDIGISRLEQLLPRAEKVGWYVDDVLRALIRAHEKVGDLPRALKYVDDLTLYFGAMRTRQLHQQLAQVQQNVLGELDEASHAEVLLGEQAASLRVKRFNAVVAERERTLLENWAVAASLIDDETGKHCFRVGRLACLVAVRLGFDDERAGLIEMAARLHDIGKIGISHQILLKPSMLTEAERVIIRKHPAIGAEMLSRATHPGAKLAATVSATHHEWWDGTGYPNGLRHEAIPIESRIVALADVYDVLTTGRIYKQPWPHQMAVDELRFMGGRQFDPELVHVFVDVVDEYFATFGEAGDEALRSAVQDCSLIARQADVRRLVDAVD